jgi:HPr kinase/phosphorylase
MTNIFEKSIQKKDTLTVELFYEKTSKKFDLKLCSKKNGFSREINETNLHRPGLALAGFLDLFPFQRIQIFGNTEFSYLAQLDSEKRRESLERIFNYSVPCIITTDNNEPFPEMLEFSDQYDISIFASSFSTTKLVYLISDFLDDQFSSQISIHGSFVDVYGVGMLFVGEAGIGKSEVALDLVERGHRLVADDVVIFTKKGEGILMGSGTDLVQHSMEIRGVGIIDVRSIFGIRSIRFQKRLEIIIELEIWDEKADYTRTGLENSVKSVMNIDIPYVKLPIVPGKNITVISEVIALNYLLKHYGYDAAKELQKRLASKIKEKNKENFDRSVDYFEHDFE